MTASGDGAELAATDAVLELAFATTGCPDLFNPYAERRADVDRPAADAIRRRNLRRYLDAVTAAPVAELWLAEAPGARGGARTGVPLVPETRFDRFAALTGIELERATTGPAQGTATAHAVWAHVERRGRLPLLWNAVLHHPHPPGRPQGNRPPRTGELAAFADLRRAALHLAPGARVVAIGRVAERALGGRCTYVRHPSQGGRNTFEAQMAAL